MTQQTIRTSEQTATRSVAAAPAILALLLGAFLILGTGFAHSEIVHSAAHDARHAFAFPCH